MRPLLYLNIIINIFFKFIFLLFFCDAKLLINLLCWPILSPPPKTQMRILGPSPKFTWKSWVTKSNYLFGSKPHPPKKNIYLESSTGGARSIFTYAQCAYAPRIRPIQDGTSDVCLTYWMFQMHSAHMHYGQVNKFRQGALFILNFKIYYQGWNPKLWIYYNHIMDQIWVGPYWNRIHKNNKAGLWNKFMTESMVEIWYTWTTRNIIVC